MGNTEEPAFVPVLTVMVDYGNAPFRWLVDKADQGGIGPNWCDSTSWDKSFPMSEGSGTSLQTGLPILIKHRFTRMISTPAAGIGKPFMNEACNSPDG